MDFDIGLELKYILIYVLFNTVIRGKASDDFSFLYSKLTSFQAHACDGEQLNLTCTPSTVISVQFVQYGRQSTSRELCPGQKPYYSSCTVQDALKVIQAQCHTGKVCRVLMSPRMFPNDPCRGVRKYAEVMYKCRPEEFLNKVVCENNYLHLKCPPGQAIIILSAFFGTTKNDIIDCPQDEHIASEDCHIGYADQTVDRLCSGKENCTLKADTFTFGDPVCKGRKHLKVKYGCVEKMVLVKPSSGSLSSEETIETTSFPGWFRGKDQSSIHQNHQWPPGNYVVQSTQSSHSLRSEMQSDEDPTDFRTTDLQDDRRVVKLVSGWVSAQKYVTGNKEKLILYVTVSLGVGFLIFVTVLASRIFLTRIAPKPDSNNVNPDATEDPFFSDSDLEQFDVMSDDAMPPPPPLVHYTASMKRKDSEALPRALVVGNGHDVNHYFS